MAKKEKKTDTEPKASGIPNMNKCCTCNYYPKHIHGEAQPCKFAKKYVARKCDACASYKCKFN